MSTLKEKNKTKMLMTKSDLSKLCKINVVLNYSLFNCLISFLLYLFNIFSLTTRGYSFGRFVQNPFFGCKLTIRCEAILKTI